VKHLGLHSKIQSRAISNKAEKQLGLNPKTLSRAIGNKIYNTSTSTRKSNQERLVTGPRTPLPQLEIPSRAIGDKAEKYLGLHSKTHQE